MKTRRTDVTLVYVSETKQTSADGSYQKGDTVQFLGGPHYVSSAASTANGTPTAGPAKITATAPGAAHPYHVIHTDTSSTVYGWVDASEITTATSSDGESTSSTWADIIGEWSSFTYTDPSEGEADSISVGIFDRDKEWLDKKMPELGAKITAKIEAKNWGDAPGGGTLECGAFVLDDYSFSGWPVEGTVKAVSVPADSGFRETERTKIWKNVTIEQVGQEIASNAGITLEWDAEGSSPTINSLEQTTETDCSFFKDLCEKYGYCIKVYESKLVVYDREAYKKKDAVTTLTKADVKQWSWAKKLAHTYTGGTYKYTIPVEGAKDKTGTVTVGEGTRMLNKSGKAESLADAELKIKAAIANANHSATTMSCTVMGRTDLVSAVCINMEGFGKLSGKYFIDSAEHKVLASSGYETSLEMSKVEEG